MEHSCGQAGGAHFLYTMSVAGEKFWLVTYFPSGIWSSENFNQSLVTRTRW
jgi:hypothetical protein